MHTLVRAASGGIPHKVLYNSRSSLGPIDSEYTKAKFEPYNVYEYDNGRLIIRLPDAVPKTVKDLGMPDRPKRIPRLPFRARGSKPLTAEQSEARGEGSSYVDYCNVTRPKVSGPLLPGMS